ncbi:hypothetical protein KY289_027145 [Solanum tuberosum]|nr:hypothetical protein KY289_027145 [Solanum tuberosum]
MINYLFTSILLFLVLIITLKYIYSSRKRLPLPPGPFPWPLIGNLLQIGKTRPHAALAKLAQVHGPDFMSIRFGTRLIVVASSPAAAAEVLKTHDRVLSGRYVSRVGSPVFYESSGVSGRGVGEEMMKYLREFTETGATQELADMFPVLGAICSMNFQRTREEKDSQTSMDAVDFVDALVKNGFTDKYINALLMELFGAGSETTIVTSEWMLVDLLKNHQCLTKLRDEIANVVGDKDVIIRESDLTNMPYLDACLKETLRLHPPGPLLLPHRAVETSEVMGYRIPKDTQVMVNMWAIVRDPKVWDDPSSFKPERFMNSKMDYKGRDFEYIPFGSGRRMCAGEPLASRFVPLVVASLVHKFDWFLPNDMNPDQIDMDEILDLIISKKDPILVIPKLRK